ncbi:hypothetical protein HRI_002605400 [Hibiscus trionum]|uniref:Uncharacterized protein n=1 Tax=Hibiscus trionum TaxID=183268 RepID=A0A9W7M6J0_HIBTR|nr:hypothetical protein HRI_002605400 [Hibiscus trionum]
MFRFKKTQIREGRYKHNRDNPSFSSSLLDQICRSIDDNNGVAGTGREESLKFCRETMQKQACLVDKRMENKVSDKKIADRIFFSSSSSSSGSSYGGFSSSDTESMYGLKTKAPCFVPSRHKPVGTSLSAPPGKPLFYEQRPQDHVVDVHAPKSSSAVKIHGDLKKTKQPVSPGSRLASFIYSLFTTGNNNSKKTKNPTSTLRHDDEVSTVCSSTSRSCLSKNSPSVSIFVDGDGRPCGQKCVYRGQGSRMLPVSASTLRYDDEVSTTCSSSSRPCISNNSPLTREKSCDRVKRRVRFCPASIVVDHNSRPCEKKCVYEEQRSRLRPILVPTTHNIGNSPSRKSEDNHYIDEDDDASSDSSSDLFELDLVLMSNERYREELPVYETTNVKTNRAIANGLIL